MSGEDEAHVAYIKTLPCVCASWREGCEGPTQAHHIKGQKLGASLRAHDHDCMPLCRKHHRMLHDLQGTFGQWSGEFLAKWQAQVAAGYWPCSGPPTCNHSVKRQKGNTKKRWPKRSLPKGRKLRSRGFEKKAG